MVNGIINDCRTSCYYGKIEFRDILIENYVDDCKVNQWMTKQINIASYDMLNSVPRLTTQIEKLSLINFYINLNGDFWVRNDNWLSGDPCIDNWYGVTCNLKGNVISLYYKQNGLNGIITDDVKFLDNLKYLYIFNDYSNDNDSNYIFNINPNITLLPNIKEVVIKNVNLWQNVDSSFFEYGNSLEILDLSFNKINSTFKISPGYLDGLKRLNLANNYIRGDLTDLKNLPFSIESIQLQNNFITGTLPLFPNLINLKVLDLRNNLLTGTLDREYINQQSFRDLEYIGLMLNNIKLPEPCKYTAFCVPRLLNGLRSTDDKEFKLTGSDYMYLYKREINLTEILLQNSTNS